MKARLDSCGLVLLILLLVFILLTIAESPTLSCRAGAGEPCIFKGKDAGWDKFEMGESHKSVHPVASESWKWPNTTLYLTMASYRDKLCPGTLFNLYSKAAYPERIFVGVVQQNSPGDEDCYDKYCELIKAHRNLPADAACPYTDNIRMSRKDASEARGPTWARAIGSELLRDEEFCMQTDSHMDFVPRWDDLMMQMWAAAENEYAVLSTYVADSASLKDNMPGAKGTNGLFEVPHLCMVRFHGSHGMPRNWGTKCMRSMPRPKLTNMVWGAGLSFSKCHAERKVPYDPHTPHIFDGEEFSRALRFWTWGYDIYSPHRVYVVHHYRASQSDPKHMSWGSQYRVSPQQKMKEVQASVRRLQLLFDMKKPSPSPQYLALAASKHPSELAARATAALIAENGTEERLQVQQGRYGLGDRRTLDQAIAFSGVDTRHSAVLGNRCGSIDFVPFQEHPWGPEYVPSYDPDSEAFADVRDPGSVYFSAAQHLAAWTSADEQRRTGRKGGGDHRGAIEAPSSETAKTSSGGGISSGRYRSINQGQQNRATATEGGASARAPTAAEGGVHGAATPALAGSRPLMDGASSSLSSVGHAQLGSIGAPKTGVSKAVVVQANIVVGLAVLGMIVFRLTKRRLRATADKSSNTVASGARAFYPKSA